jgi:hypothetical protein
MRILKTFTGILLLSSVMFLSNCKSQDPKKDITKNLEAKKQRNDRWKIDGEKIVWNVKDVHKDKIEMSGLQISGIISYGSDENGDLYLSRKIIWPMLRTVPNDTHASLTHIFDQSPVYTIEGKKITKEHLDKVELDGMLHLYSSIDEGVEVKRTIFPGTDLPIYMELITLINNSDKKKVIKVNFPVYQFDTKEKEGVYGVYKLTAEMDRPGTFSLDPGQKKELTIQFTGRKSNEAYQLYNPEDEFEKRSEFLTEMSQSLVLETPDPVVNKMFAFAKIRAAESIYKTRGGLMHGPGGGSYYAAIWANDQAEYVNPFFPFLGNENGNESAINSFRHFARFMNDDYKPIPSSIIAEGTDIWNGAGDRGDMAMIAYGASRFALAYGDKKIAEELFPLIEWSLEYCERQKTKDGIIASDTDELEGRFKTGKANLTTSVLTYGGLVSASHLADELGRSDLSGIYRERAKELRKAINRYFGATMEGFKTYRYFDGNKKLRSWISIPLTMGIFERKEGTIEALLSPYLWSENGVYTEAGQETFWDRATLYTLRGIFNAGETDVAYKALENYSKKRLLGDHVPYAVEAWPEGGQQHLSAESGLYCRVITEGMFGIEPTGFRKFTCAPVIPEGWNSMALKNIKAFQHDFDLIAKRVSNGIEISILENGQVVQKKIWNGKNPVEFVLN